MPLGQRKVLGWPDYSSGAGCLWLELGSGLQNGRLPRYMIPRSKICDILVNERGPPKNI